MNKMLENKLQKFEHNWNPMHLYNEMRNIGLDIEESLKIIKLYEEKIYLPIKNYIQKSSLLLEKSNQSNSIKLNGENNKYDI